MKWIFKVEEYGLGFLLLFISLFMCLQVILRYVFASSVFWAEELMRYLMVLMIFFGASLGIEKGTHIGMDALAKGVSERNRALIESISFFLAIMHHPCHETALPLRSGSHPIDGAIRALPARFIPGK